MKFQQRHHDYVLGPNQDSRLASVAPGAVVKGLDLHLDTDAPFVLRSRALWSDFTNGNGVAQTDLQLLKTRWTGPALDYRQQGYVSEAAQMAYFGQFGCPKPVGPIQYPAGGILRVDLYNASSTITITNLSFLWRGVKLFPLGSVPGYTYPEKCGIRPFDGYQINITALAAGASVTNQIFTVKPDADFVLRGLQAEATENGTPVSRNIGFQLLDWTRKPYSNDYVRLDVLAGRASQSSADTSLVIFPVGTGSKLAPLGTGPGAAGLLFPEIYVPANHQLLYSVSRNDASIAGAAAANITVNLIGAKVFKQE